jgi:uncharacterized protein YgiM (DUF1202 family)
MKQLALILISILLLLTVGCTALSNTNTLPTSTQSLITGPVESTPLETAVPTSAATTVPTDVPATAIPTEQKPPMTDLGDEQIDLQLAQAIEQRNFETLRTLMKDRFSFATWNTELREITSEEALQSLLETYFASGSTPQVKFSTDVPALLGGADPLAIWGPNANPIRAVHLTGLGPSSSGEAVLIIGKDKASGELYWHGLLVPQGTTFQASSEPSGDAVQTDVRYVMAKEDLNVRSGPGETYAVEGLMRAGEVAQVSGKSVDGVWWQITCTSDASGFCWISAIATLSEPVDAPER